MISPPARVDLSTKRLIASSRIVSVDLQTDGRSYVVEAHTDLLRGELRITYLAEPGTDVNAVMDARRASLNG